MTKHIHKHINRIYRRRVRNNIVKNESNKHFPTILNLFYQLAKKHFPFFVIPFTEQTTNIFYAMLCVLTDRNCVKS